mmetsp:Transcript_74/g.151  ORF Transcript_74/g.151 Transcript_74/m.151 type:complete len:263 (-) Transcript_74:36-824(-)
MPFRISSLLFQVPGQVAEHIREEFPQWRLFLCLTGFHCQKHLFLCSNFCRLGFLLVPDTSGFQELLPTGQRADALQLLHLLFVLLSVGRGVVGGGVVPDSVGHELQQNGGFLFNGFLARCLCCDVHGDKVIAIHTDGGNGQGWPSGGNSISPVLVLNARRNGVAVVSANKQGLRAVHGGEVEPCEGITFGCGPVTKVSHGNTVLFVQLVCITRSWSLRNLGAQHCVHRLHVLLQHAIVHLQVPPFAPITLIANILVSNLLCC